MSRLHICLTVLAFAAAATSASAQGRFNPGLILDTGGRTSTCDALLFTADGNELLAAGDDKVVRTWRLDDNRLTPGTTLRWSIFREQRGSIYSLALSPDESTVAVAGLSVLSGQSAVLIDRATGAVRAAVDLPTHYPIRALAFSPSGKGLALGQDDGAVWHWSGERDAKAVRLGGHRFDRRDDEYDRVRLVFYRDRTHVLSVAEDGVVKEWDLERPQEGGRDVERFTVAAGSRGLAGAAVSCDGRRIAAGGSSGWVEVVTLGGGPRFKRSLKAREVPRRFAFSRDGKGLAVGVRTYPPDDVGFLAETDFRVTVFAVDAALTPRATLPTTYYPDAVAFHPDGTRLAVAGGANHEVTLWKIAAGAAERLAEAPNPGTCLWSVALSRDGRRVGFRDRRNTDPRGVDDYGAGPWRVFDLETRRWGRAADFEPLPPTLTHPEWKVDTGSSFDWYVVGPDGRKQRLPLDANTDLAPRCYSFLPSEKGKPTRLAVGHYYGFSVFELEAGAAPRRVRLAVGHEGEVMALALSADGRSVVTASRDMTLAGWRLAPWDYQAELGALCAVRDGAVVVERVAAGSPAWDANAQKDTTATPLLDGLQEGDRVVLFAFGPNGGGGEFLYDSEGRWREKHGRFDRVGTAKDCVARLRQPVPGKQCYFVVRRDGVGEVELQTTVRQRPLWRFFPTKDGEWVLWRWRDFAYDTSTRGDQYVGWQVSGGVAETPRFFRAEQMRARFHKPDKLALALPPNDAPPERLVFDGLVPPVVEVMTPPERTVKDKGVTLAVRARPAGPGDDQKLQRVVLWVNDYRVPGLPAVTGEAFEAPLTVPETLLVQGENTLTLQVYNRGRGREQRVFKVTYSSSKRASRGVLHGLVVGINRYDSVKNLDAGPSGSLNLDFARGDAIAVKALLEEQRGRGLFREVRVREPLLDRGATRAAVLDALKDLKTKVEADDRLVLFLAGHGITNDKEGPDSFYFVLPGTDGKDLRTTALAADEFMTALGEVPCRKVLLLDACHSGRVLARRNVIRALGRDGVGSFVLTACDSDESAYERRDLGHGAFTRALLDAAGGDFAKADTSKDGQLDFKEIAEFVAAQAQRLVDPFGMTQSPKYSPPAPETLPLFGKATKR